MTDPTTCTVLDAREIQNTLTRELACTIIQQAIRVLCLPSKDDDAAARSIGFENSEHEVLAFLGSDWFDTLVHLACPDYDRPIDEMIQSILDKVYDGKIVVVPSKDGLIRRRRGRRPKGKGYTPHMAHDADGGTELLEAYNRILEVEQVTTDCIVLEVPLTSTTKQEVVHA
jgi:hypothetical protein